MRRALWIALLGAGLLPLVLLACLRIGLLTPFVNFALSHGLNGRTPLQVRVGTLRSDVLSFIEADDVVVLAPVHGAKLPLLTIASLRLEYQGWLAWRGRVDPQEALRLARVKGLNLFLLREAGGQWNISSLLGPKAVSVTAKAPAHELPLIPAARMELEDSQLVLNDETKGFHSTIDRLQGSLDTRALPLMAFSLNGRTEGHSSENLSLAGELDQRDGAFYGRLDLAGVELAHYLNYFLPGGGLRFEDGKASLSVRLRRAPGAELDASGRAEISGGSLRIPGVSQPLSGLQGVLAFDPQSLRFKGVQAQFLGSVWSASGAILDLRHPRYEIALEAPTVPLQVLSEQVHGMALLALTGTAALQATLSGPALQPMVQARVTAPLMGIFGVEMQSVSAVARLQGSHLTISGLRATLWQGHLAGDAEMGLAAGGKLHADLQLDGARLEDARIRGQTPLPLSGTAWLEFKAGGLLRAPSLELDLEVSKAGLGVLPLGDLEGHAAWSPQGLSSRFKALQGRLDGQINISRGPEAAFHDSLIIFKGMDVGGLAQGLATAGSSMVLPSSAIRAGAGLVGVLAGRLDARLSLEGPAHAPTLWLEAQMPQGHLYTGAGTWALKDPEAGLDLHLDGALGFQAGDLLLGRNKVPFKAVVGQKGHSLEAQALGRFPLHSTASPGHLELNLDGDLKFLDAFELFKKSQGRLQTDLRLGGTLDSPLAQGELHVTGFATEPQSYLAPVKGGELLLQFHDQAIDVPMLHFHAGGELAAKGSFDLSAGLKGLQGDLQVDTDDEGVRLQNWEAMGSGNVALEALKLHLEGDAQPVGLSGRLKLSNALVVYAGHGKGKDAAEGDSPPKLGRGLSLNLKVGLGANVWYEKHQTKSVDLFDPTKWLGGIADSAIETLQMPDIFFRLRPTEEDFIIRGTTPDLELLGEISIDRGRLTVMENDFEIKPDQKAARVRFNGKHAEVWATAVGRLRYMRDDPLTHRPVQKAVNVIADIQPLSPEELEKSDLAKAFPNYRPSFSSEPEIMPNNPESQKIAVLNLVVLGDPLVDLTEGPSAVPGESQSNAQSLGTTQINRIISAEARKQIAKWSRKGFKFLGTNFIDVFRVVPRFKYQSTAASAPVLGTTAADASKQAQESQLVFSDLTMEVGKSLGERLYASFQWIRFGENGTQANTNLAGQSNLVTRDQGMRAGLEYQVSANRTLEGYFNYSVDENLEPVPFDPNNLDQARSYVLRLRNTIPTDNYGLDAERRRRWAVRQDQNGEVIGGKP